MSTDATLRKENKELRDRIKVLEASLNQNKAVGQSVDLPLVHCEKTAKGNTAESDDPNRTLTFVVLGASGDLAKKKTYPALFKLFVNGYLPKDVIIYGYARTKMDMKKFWAKINSSYLKGTDEQKNEFKKRLHYFSGQYDSEESFKALTKELEQTEKSVKKDATGANRIFYMALPPVVFVSSARCIKAAAMSSTGWNRVIVEKPFGMDLESSRQMSRDLAQYFVEHQVYRIDHYLGKEMVQNLMTLRFANTVFEPLWNHNFIKCVLITFKENFGTEGRGGYFDKFGIIRDVMQNHLTQIFSLIAMEAPVSLAAQDVRNEKVKVLRSTPPIDFKHTVVGQYTNSEDGQKPAYTDDETVPKGSIAPTYCAATLFVNNPRWQGVPFIMRGGKALNERKAEIRIQFKDNSPFLFPNGSRNELVLKIQPQEAVYLKMMSKVPGLSSELVETELDLSYHKRFEEVSKGLPDAYERLILDVVRGDQNLFVRGDELDAAWRIFTPLLHHLEKNKVQPVKYAYGTRGPKEYDELTEKFGYKHSKGYKWPGPKM